MARPSVGNWSGSEMTAAGSGDSVATRTRRLVQEHEESSEDSGTPWSWHRSAWVAVRAPFWNSTGAWYSLGRMQQHSMGANATTAVSRIGSV